jgi:peptide-methionine (R)-S-oxide reductase
MPTRRQILYIAGTAFGLSPVLNWIADPGAHATQMKTDEQFAIQKTEDEWRKTLSPEQYHVLRDHGTERAFTSPLNAEKRPGTFVCAACGQPLFDARTKFESGTGWPSFYQSLPGATGTQTDRSWFMTRTEVHCSRCGGHLGHVFPDGPPPTGQRYCMNGLAMKFEPKPGS